MEHQPAFPGHGQRPSADELSAGAARALERAEARWSSEFGTGSRGELRAACTTELLANGGGAARADELCRQLERAHMLKYGERRLRAELADECDRERARSSQAGVVSYERKWQRKLARLQRAHPGRFHVPGLSEPEVRDALTLHLLELCAAPRELGECFHRAGREWGLIACQQQLRALRGRFRLAATPMDFRDAPLLSRAPSQEERWLERETSDCRSRAEEAAQAQLNGPQRRWLSALTSAAAQGEFFASSDELNLSAASRLLGKNRSSALRAYRALQTRFQDELERIERSGGGFKV